MNTKKKGKISAYNNYQHLLNCEGARLGVYMKASRTFNGLSWHTGVLVLFTMFILSGCATKDYVGKQVNPLSDRVSQTEIRVGQAEDQIGQLSGRMTTNEGKINSLEGKLDKVDAKAERALATLGNLKLEYRLVIEMKEGTNFAFNSATLSDEAKEKIDEFLGNLKGNLAGGQNALFLVEGHTDNVGSDDFNYELGKRRADTVKRYLVTQGNINPLCVVTVSYGENSPITENDTRDSRARNRRVEILVYSEAINSNIATTQAQE